MDEKREEISYRLLVDDEEQSHLQEVVPSSAIFMTQLPCFWCFIGTPGMSVAHTKCRRPRRFGWIDEHPDGAPWGYCEAPRSALVSPSPLQGTILSVINVRRVRDEEGLLEERITRSEACDSTLLHMARRRTQPRSRKGGRGGLAAGWPWTGEHPKAASRKRGPFSKASRCKRIQERNSEQKAEWKCNRIGRSNPRA